MGSFRQILLYTNKFNRNMLIISEMKCVVKRTLHVVLYILNAKVL